MNPSNTLPKIGDRVRVVKRGMHAAHNIVGHVGMVVGCDLDPHSDWIRVRFTDAHHTINGDRWMLAHELEVIT